MTIWRENKVSPVTCVQKRSEGLSDGLGFENKEKAGTVSRQCLKYSLRFTTSRTVLKLFKGR